jgi:hypothetical protein
MPCSPSYTVPPDAGRQPGHRLDLSAAAACTEQDLAFCATALAQEHALGAGHPAGRRLYQIVRRAADQEPVAVLLWAASALHLKDRDAWIGWDGMTRSRRLALIVNNSRLLLLEKTREPNLATQVLAAALRALPAQWSDAHGYEPLLAE